MPWYFFTGGLMGGAATLALAAEWRGDERLAWSARVVAMCAGTASPVLLISDLGRPARFLNMMRVFRPTSPMSVGSWLLAVAGTSNGLAAAWKVFGLFERVEPRGAARGGNHRSADDHVHGRAARQHRDPGVAGGAERASLRVRRQRGGRRRERLLQRSHPWRRPGRRAG